MNDQLRRVGIRRKIIYLGMILGLFTVSMFWRGKLALPFGSSARAAEAERNGVSPRWNDWIAQLPIKDQAEKLEMRELDLGDAEVAGSAARVSLVGFRGIAVTGMWWAAIEKQKRGEYHKFELLARTVARLQPHFISPWVFQAWNISYNISVENDKLGDMYFYIARGIELLAEGERLNTREYRDPSGVMIRVGSPDIRYQLAFSYQNKFTVSDKVATLRCLMQLSAMKPSERDPKYLLDDLGKVRPDKFREFCENNPQLVRRLFTKLDCKTPRDVVDFLRTNRKVPSRYIDDDSDRRDEFKPDDDQFPIFPPSFPSDQPEYTPRKETTDTFDALMAARAWFEYANLVIPPPVNGAMTPKAAPVGRPPSEGEYDPFRYRMPERPDIAVFRTGPCRSQTYIAERLQKEGWFSAKTEWTPDDSAETPWFGKGTAGKSVMLHSKDNSQAEWATANTMWRLLGVRNGYLLTPNEDERLFKLASATAVLGMPIDSYPQYKPNTDAEFERFGITREQFNARMFLATRRSKLGITNFMSFYYSTGAEKSDELIAARILLYNAEEAKKQLSFTSAIGLYAEAIARYREALRKFPDYQAFDKSDTVQEEDAKYEIALVQLLKGDESVTSKLPAAKETFRALVPEAPETIDVDWRNVLAENEAQSLIAMQLADRPLDTKVDEKAGELFGALLGPTLGEQAGREKGAEANAKRAVRRNLIDGEFAWMKKFSADPENPLVKSREWVRDDVRRRVKESLGLLRSPPPPPQPEQPPGEPPR